MIPIHENIKKIRISKQFTQQYVADKLGMTQSGYNNLESGKSGIPTSRIEELAKILEVSVIELMVPERPFPTEANIIEDSKSKEEIKNLYEQMILQYKDHITDLRGIIGELREKADYYKKQYESTLTKKVKIPNLDKTKKK